MRPVPTLDLGAFPILLYDGGVGTIVGLPIAPARAPVGAKSSPSQCFCPKKISLVGVHS